ncbi:hypothetical protein PF002_g33064 [Phytophthora fragariae]|uniref:Uncharacterized protein n=1 Tax=Phytophthora fragariae TaxID=53985 RepID=A0A6A3V4P3_9STRA|nr:hypothetical protein PF002_g33064 [Phytophthora fragariae]
MSLTRSRSRVRSPPPICSCLFLHPFTTAVFAPPGPDAHATIITHRANIPPASRYYSARAVYSPGENTIVKRANRDRWEVDGAGCVCR